MEAALTELRSSGSLSIASAAKGHGVTKLALSSRFHAKTDSLAQGAKSRRIFNDKQEEELVSYIHHLCGRCLPPTPKIVRRAHKQLESRSRAANRQS